MRCSGILMVILPLILCHPEPPAFSYHRPALSYSPSPVIHVSRDPATYNLQSPGYMASQSIARNKDNEEKQEPKFFFVQFLPSVASQIGTERLIAAPVVMPVATSVTTPGVKPLPSVPHQDNKILVLVKNALDLSKHLASPTYANQTYVRLYTQPIPAANNLGNVNFVTLPGRVQESTHGQIQAPVQEKFVYGTYVPTAAIQQKQIPGQFQANNVGPVQRNFQVLPTPNEFIQASAGMELHHKTPVHLETARNHFVIMQPSQGLYISDQQVQENQARNSLQNQIYLQSVYQGVYVNPFQQTVNSVNANPQYIQTPNQQVEFGQKVQNLGGAPIGQSFQKNIFMERFQGENTERNFQHRPVYARSVKGESVHGLNEDKLVQKKSTQEGNNVEKPNEKPDKTSKDVSKVEDVSKIENVSKVENMTKT